MREARGVYVAPIDADDLWEPDNLERQVAALEAAGPDACMAFARTVFVDSNARPLPAAVWCPWETRTDTPKPPDTDFRGLLLRNSVANGSAAVFRRDRMLEAGGYDESLRAAGGRGRGGLEVDSDAGRARARRLRAGPDGAIPHVTTAACRARFRR